MSTTETERQLADLRNAIRHFIADFDCIAWGPEGDHGSIALVQRLENALYPDAAPISDDFTTPQRYIKIERTSHDALWYSRMVGQTLPLLWVDSSGYWVLDEADGSSSMVKFGDATLVSKP